MTKTSIINLGVMNFVPFKCIWSIQINKVEVCNFKLTVFHEIHVKVFTLHHILKLNFIPFLLKMCLWCIYSKPPTASMYFSYLCILSVVKYESQHFNKTVNKWRILISFQKVSERSRSILPTLWFVFNN